MKKTILHIIDNLGRGGAETMLVNVINHLNDFEHIVVTLNNKNEFGPYLKCNKIICLNIDSMRKSPVAAIRLRKIISRYNIELVHSHLFWSTVVARLGVPSKIPLFSTIHTSVASSPEYKPLWIKLVERFSYRFKKSVTISVSNTALAEYKSLMKISPRKAFVLYNFVDDKFLCDIETLYKKSNFFRVVTVGNLKEVKNHQFLLDAFKKLKDKNICLDIYGTGPLQKTLQDDIDKHQLNVTLKGQAKDIEQKLKMYDLFVMSSHYEGFSISVLEAMAAGIGLLVTDIASFKEQCGNTACYFVPNNIEDFLEKILMLKDNHEMLLTFSGEAKKRVRDNFTIAKHIEKLKEIYAGETSLQF